MCVDVYHTPNLISVRDCKFAYGESVISAQFFYSHPHYTYIEK